MLKNSSGDIASSPLRSNSWINLLMSSSSASYASVFCYAPASAFSYSASSSEDIRLMYLSRSKLTCLSLSMFSMKFRISSLVRKPFLLLSSASNKDTIWSSVGSGLSESSYFESKYGCFMKNWIVSSRVHYCLNSELTAISLMILYRAGFSECKFALWRKCLSSVTSSLASSLASTETLLISISEGKCL